MQDLTVTIVQEDLAWHDAAANRKRLGRHIEEAGDSDLLVLPEMFSSGFTMAPKECAEKMDGPTVAWMREQAQQTGMALCGSLVIEDGGRYYNRFIFQRPDGTVETYDKRHRFALAGEDRHYAAGDRRLVLEYKGWQIAPFICYDLRFPAWCRHASGCDLMLFVANWPAPRHTAWSTLVRARAIENQCYVAAVNRVGIDGKGHKYAGGSVIHDYLGEVLADCDGGERSASATLSAEQLQQGREKLPFFRDADDFEFSP